MKLALTPSSYVSREEFILRRCAGKDILHLGFLGETDRPLADRLEYVSSDRSLHSRLKRSAQRVAGVDLDKEAIAYLRNHGLTDIYFGNVEFLEQSDMPRLSPFSVIVAGDIIEHLGNPGLMLESLKGVLGPGGEIIVTTPNSFGLPNYVRFLNGSYREGPDHVQSYSAFTLAQLLARYGWEISEIHTCYEARAAAIRGPLAFHLGRWLLQRVPKLGGTLLAVCRLRVD